MRVIRGVNGAPYVPPLQFPLENGQSLCMTFPAEYAPYVIVALSLYTQIGQYDGSDYDAIADTIQGIYAIINSIGECGVSDCADLQDCFDGVNKTVYNLQVIIQTAQAQEAEQRYDDALEDVQVYNPSAPSHFALSAVPDDRLFLCVAALTFTVEFARKIDSYARFQLGLIGINMFFGGIAASLSRFVPSWLAGINNYVVLPLSQYFEDFYQDTLAAANDELAVKLLSCRLADQLVDRTLTYAEYEAVLDAIPQIVGFDDYNILLDRMQLWCKNTPAFLYMVDLLARVHDENDPALECPCDEPFTVKIRYDYRIQKWGSYDDYVFGHTYSAEGWHFHNGGSTAGESLVVQQPLGSPQTVHSVECFYIRATPDGIPGVPPLRIYLYNAAGALITFKTTALPPGGSAPKSQVVTFDNPVPNVSRIEVNHKQRDLAGSICRHQQLHVEIEV